jgi:hypothetical protein
LFRVTYKNVLHRGKGLADFQEWLNAVWKIQHSWGADSVFFWSEKEGDLSLVICEYTVRDIDRWNRLAMSDEASHLSRPLEAIAETRKITVRPVYTTNGITDGEGEPFRRKGRSAF